MARKAKKEESTKAAPAAQKKAPKGSWYDEGNAGFEKKRELDTVATLRKEKFVSRFWLKAGESARIVIVADNPFFIHEHNLQVGGKYGNFATCVKDFDPPCRVCETKSDSRPVYCGYITIIDTRSYTNKEGKVIKNQKKLLPLKGSAIPKFEDLKKKHGNLAGMMFEVKRYTADEPNCGANFDKLGRVDLLKKLGKESTTPFDYKKVLAPPSPEELAAYGIYGGHAVGSTADVEGAGVATATDDELENLL